MIHTTDYRRIKHILSLGDHPSFVGRTMVHRAGVNGGTMVFTWQGEDVAAALVQPRKNVLNVLNVAKLHRSHGLGSAILDYLQCNWARVIESAVPFFERNGYIVIGEPKQGNTFKTFIMVKKSLIPLAGRIATLYAPQRSA